MAKIAHALFVGLLLAPAAAMTPAAATVAPAGWDHAGYDAEDSFYNPGESSVNAGTVTGLTRRWSVALRRDQDACGGPSAPLVAAGTVIVSDERGIASYRAASGRPAWQYDWADPDDTSTPAMAVSGGVLIAASGDCHSMSDPDGSLDALDAATGRERWHVGLPMPPQTFVVDKGFVVVSGSSPSDELETVAYRVADGRVAWRRPGWNATGVSADGRMLLTRDRLTTAIDVSTGATLWTRPAQWVAESASPAGDRFFVSNGTALSAVRASDGLLLWTAPNRTPGLIANDGRRVYVAAERAVEALDAGTGRRVWWRQIPGPSVQPTRAGGLLYTGGPVLSAATGAVVTPGAAFAGARVITGGRLYAVNGNTMAGFTP